LTEAAEHRPSWETRWYVAALILAAYVPLLYPAVPPLVDLMGHMGRYRIQLDLASSPDLQRFYDFDWKLIGNLGVDLLVVPLAKLLGLEAAVKLIVASIPPLTVAGFLWVAREVHGRLPPTAAFAVPFALGHPFLFGFVNFCLAMAFAFLAFGLWLRLARTGRLKLRAALFVPISFVLFVTHAFGWGTLGLLAFSAEAVRQHDKGIAWWKAGLRAVPHCAVMLGPALLMLDWRSEVSKEMTRDWFNLEAKWRYLVMTLRDRWQVADVVSFAIPLLMLAEAIRRRSLTYSRNLAFSALVLLAGFLMLPRIVFGSAYADMRLVPFVVATALLAIRFKGETDYRVARVIAWAGLVYATARLALLTVSTTIAANDQSAKLKALDHVPHGAALVTLIGDGCFYSWDLPRNAHLAGMGIVRRHAFSNDQWTIEGSNPLTVKFRQAGWFADDPSQMVEHAGCHPRKRPTVALSLRLLPTGVFDYLWVIDLPPHDPALFASYRKVWEGAGSALYDLRPAAEGPRSATPRTAEAAARPGGARSRTAP
jgi:hypothetical protein